MDIKTFLKEIKPTAVIVKNLEKNFINNSDYNGLNKKTYKKIKRYIKDKLIYKCLINSVDLVYVSNAYTDKICSKCKSFDTIRTEYDL